MNIYEVKERNAALCGALLNIWESSVRATHAFLSGDEVEKIKEYVPQALLCVRHLIVAENGGVPAAFLGVENGKIEMLFVAAKRRGQGIGKALTEYAVKEFSADRVTVNEQNPQAVGFYARMGFEIYDKSDTDEQGNPYPLLYMKLKK